MTWVYHFWDAKEFHAPPQKHLHIHVYCSYAQGTKEMEPPYKSPNRWTGNENLVNVHNPISFCYKEKWNLKKNG